MHCSVVAQRQTIRRQRRFHSTTYMHRTESGIAWDSPTAKQSSPMISLIFGKHVKFSHDFAGELYVRKSIRGYESSITYRPLVNILRCIMVVRHMLTQISQAVTCVLTPTKEPVCDNERGGGTNRGNRCFIRV